MSSLRRRLAPAFLHVVVTQDWHTRGHISFASSHPGKKPFETVSLPYGTQGLWPDHCIQGTPKERGMKSVCLVGLATDFCVAWSALDARRAGFTAAVFEDGTRGIDASGSLAKAWADMTRAGVGRITPADIAT